MIIYDFEPANEGDQNGILLSIDVQPNYRNNNKKLHLRTQAGLGTTRLSGISHNVAHFQCCACQIDGMAIFVQPYWGFPDPTDFRNYGAVQQSGKECCLFSMS